jgi:hypothetical protein
VNEYLVVTTTHHDHRDTVTMLAMSWFKSPSLERWELGLDSAKRLGGEFHTYAPHRSSVLTSLPISLR